MEITPLNNKKNNENKSSIFSTSIGLFKYYISNNVKKLSNKLYSLYSNSSLLNSKNVNNSNSINPQDINSIDKEKINISNSNNIKINSNNNFNNNINNLNIENELLIFNNIQIKKNIYVFLENELQINNIKLELRNSNNQIQQIKIYNEFKNKIIIHFFSSIIILKYYNIISITSLCVISLMKKIKIGSIHSNILINNKQISLLLDNLWNISTQTSKNIFDSLSEIINNKIDKIPLNEKYNKDKFINLFDSINNEIRDKCNYFIYIIKLLKENINNLEEQYFDKVSVQNNNLFEYKLKFFYIFCDIICSNIFYSSFVQSYEEEIKRKYEEIKGYFGELNEKTLLAIIYDLDTYKSKQFINNENNNDILNIDNNNKENENENKDNILLNYQICLKSIDI